MRIKLGDRCPGCHVVATPDAEHLDSCAYLGKLELVEPVSLVERERALRKQQDEHRKRAPNARDFPTWEAFYDAQFEHEAKAAEIEREIEAIVEEAWR